MRTALKRASIKAGALWIMAATWGVSLHLAHGDMLNTVIRFPH